MAQTISVNAQDLLQSLRDASSYTLKTFETDNAMAYVLLTAIPKTKKLAVIGCDGLGYYERQINVSFGKGKAKAAIPGKGGFISISPKDTATITKFIPARERSNILIEVDDAPVNDSCRVKIELSDGTSTTFFSKANLEIPDYKTIKANAEKGKKKPPTFDSVHIPVHELLRAGKVFPDKKSFAQIFTSKGIKQGIMALLECKTEGNDISVIFMLSQETTA